MKTILVTGANGGIGSAIVEKCKSEGHVVVEVTRSDADLAKEADIEALAARVLKEHGHIDWLICTHGFIDTEAVLENMEPKNIEATFAVNTLSLFYLAQQLLRHIPHGGGMITISSSAGIAANGRLSVYSASKAAANSFMQAMARNRPEQQFFALCPGPTNTAMRERIAGDAAQMQSPAVVADVAAALVGGTGEYASGDILLIKDGTTIVSRL